jgi:hypothetical protein
MTNHEQLEQLARTAKHMNSFSDYISGSATAELNAYIAEAEEIAAEAVKRLEMENAPQDRIDKVNYLLERYKVKIEKWLFDYYRCEASCPSIMISGAGNFPVRKKERQNARRKSIQENSPEYLLKQIKSMSYNADTIYSDDKNAVERLKAKIKAEEDGHEYAKRANAYYNKNGTLKGFEDMTDEQAAQIESKNGGWSWWQPFSTLNNTANIRRLKDRLLQLAPAEITAEKVITINGIAANYQSIIAFFDGKTPRKSVYQSMYSGEEISYYIEIPLVFSDGGRKYSEFLQIETDESGENLKRYNSEKKQSELFPLTDERKFNCIIGKIRGSGNKAVIYSILKAMNLKAEAVKQSGEQAEESGTINGESVVIKRNKDVMRLQIFFDGIPQPETRHKMKSNGFIWAPSNRAWQRLLNDNAEYSIKKLLKGG